MKSVRSLASVTDPPGLATRDLFLFLGAQRQQLPGAASTFLVLASLPLPSARLRLEEARDRGLRAHR